MENYFLCSKSLVDLIKPGEVSKPFKSGYDTEIGVDYFVAKLDFDKVKEEYKEGQDGYEDFWCRECVSGTMDASTISVRQAKIYGLLVEIERKIGLTTERNIAMTIKNLSKRFNCTPVEFINKIAKPNKL